MFAITLVAKNFINSRRAEDRLLTTLGQSDTFRSRCGKRVTYGSPRLTALSFLDAPPILNGSRRTAGAASAEIVSGCLAEELEHTVLIQAVRFNSKVDK